MLLLRNVLNGKIKASRLETGLCSTRRRKQTQLIRPALLTLPRTFSLTSIKIEVFENSF